jgi:hypothetical protein
MLAMTFLLLTMSVDVAAKTAPTTNQASQCEDLDAICPLDVRGEKVEAVVQRIAAFITEPIILDTQISEEHLNARVRLYAEHLTLYEQLRWMSRLADLEAVRVDNGILIAQRERIPLAWRVAAYSRREPPDPESIVGAAEGADESDAKRKRSFEVTIRPVTPVTTLPATQPIATQPGERERAGEEEATWLDVPWSRLTRIAARRLGVDLIVSRSVLDEQPLVSLPEEPTDWRKLNQMLESELDVEVTWLDGGFWVHPPSEPDPFGLVVRARELDAYREYGSGRPGSKDDRWIAAGPVTPTPSGRPVSDDLCDAMVSHMKEGFVDPRCRGIGTAEASGRLEDVIVAGRLLDWWGMAESESR